jgi:actin-like ATPase involved in cell morphogenesis
VVVFLWNYWSWNESRKESCERVNGKVYLIHEPMAAAIIGIDIMQPKETWLLI